MEDNGLNSYDYGTTGSTKKCHHKSFISQVNRKGSEENYQSLVIKTLSVPMTFKLKT